MSESKSQVAALALDEGYDAAELMVVVAVEALADGEGGAPFHLTKLAKVARQSEVSVEIILHNLLCVGVLNWVGGRIYIAGEDDE